MATAIAIPASSSTDASSMVSGVNTLFSGLRTEERRCTARIQRQLRAKLVGYRDPNDVSAETRDISEGGAYIVAPSDCGVRVGQRYEIMFEPVGSDASRAESGYATVIRTEHVRHGERDAAVGVGLRFDQPLYL